jgi:hypothetical protein
VVTEGPLAFTALASSPGVPGCDWHLRSFLQVQGRASHENLGCPLT